MREDGLVSLQETVKMLNVAGLGANELSDKSQALPVLSAELVVAPSWHCAGADLMAHRSYGCGGSERG